jgi:hypothetical protein
VQTDARALQLFFLIACIPPWISWSLLTFGFVPQSVPYAPLLYLTGWGCSAGGLVATYASEGRGGARRLLGRAVRVSTSAPEDTRQVPGHDCVPRHAQRRAA